MHTSFWKLVEVADLKPSEWALSLELISAVALARALSLWNYSGLNIAEGV